MIKKITLLILASTILIACQTTNSSDFIFVESTNQSVGLQEMRQKAKQKKLESAFKKMMYEEALPDVAGFHGAVRLQNNQLLAIALGIDKQGYMQVYFPFSTEFKDSQKEACVQHLEAETFQNNTLYFNKLPKSTCAGKLGEQEISLYLDEKQNWHINLGNTKTKLHKENNMAALSKAVQSEYEVALKEKIARDKKAEEERIKREKEEMIAREKRAKEEAEERKRREKEAASRPSYSSSSYSNSNSYSTNQPKYYQCKFHCEGSGFARRSPDMTDTTPGFSLYESYKAPEYIKKKYEAYCAQFPFHSGGGGTADVSHVSCQPQYY